MSDRSVFARLQGLLGVFFCVASVAACALDVLPGAKTDAHVLGVVDKFIYAIANGRIDEAVDGMSFRTFDEDEKLKNEIVAGSGSVDAFAREVLAARQQLIVDGGGLVSIKQSITDRSLKHIRLTIDCELADGSVLSMEVTVDRIRGRWLVRA